MHRLMVVDDETVIAMQLEESLTAIGYEVVGTAASGDEAREMAQDLKPDLILMDIVMPGKLDGITAADIIREELDIPVIFLTAYTERELINRAKHVEPFGYIVKPFHERELNAAIEIAFYKKESERRLRESEETLSGIVASLADHMSMVDDQHNIVWINEVAKDLFGPDLVGKKCYTVYRKLDEPCESCPAINCFQDGEVHEGETELTTAGGDPMTFWCIASAGLRHIDGRLRTVVTGCRNITERKRMKQKKKELEARLAQARKLKAIGTLAGGIAHSVNNLLMAIQSNAFLVLIDIDSTHPHYESLANIEDLVRSGAELTKQLLGYARKGQYYVQPINLNQLVEKTSEAIRRTRKDIVIDQDLADDLLAIEADQGQIEQVLMNLLVNASDAMPGGGDLILKSTNVRHEDMKGKLYDPKPGNYVQLTLSDAGTGMDKETLDRIFEPFYTTKEMGRGTGLGLASVYGIIKGHGGYIDVESKKDSGTTFTIYLPATEKKVEEAVQPAEQIIKGTETILLVDDEDRVLDVGSKVLKKLGYTVLEARGGREAVEIYKDNKDNIDLVILDMVMPRMGGGEAYDRMKEIDPNVKVLLSSGYSIDSQAKDILARGCDAFIQKPFGIEDLSVRIRGILDKK